MSINANVFNGGQQTARRVSFTPPGGGAPQVIGWVGAPVEKIAGDPPPGGFPNTEPNVFVSFLSATPHFMDWTTVGTVHLTGCGIRPGDGSDSYTYLIQTILDTADINAEPSFSAALKLPTTAKYGDTSGPLLTAGQLQPPQGAVNLQDLFAAVALFTKANEVVSVIWADTQPESPETFIAFNDIFAVVIGIIFDGTGYQFTADPCDCLGGCPPPGP